MTDLDSLRLENHRLREIVSTSDLVHIRLRAGLREALDGRETHMGSRHYETGQCEPTDPRIADLRKLVFP